MSLKEIISRNIKEARIGQGLTQADLAKTAGLSVTYLSALENSAVNISVEVLENLSKALNVPVSALVTTRGQEKSNDSTMPAKLRKNLEDAVMLIERTLEKTKAPTKSASKRGKRAT